MGTPFTEIYVKFLAQVKTHELANMPETSLEENMQLWLTNSLGYFTMCRKSLEYDLQLTSFDDELDNMKQNDELASLLMKLPDGMRSTLSAKARELIDTGELDSFNKIRVIEKALGVELESFVTKD